MVLFCSLALGLSACTSTRDFPLEVNDAAPDAGLDAAPEAAPDGTPEDDAPDDTSVSPADAGADVAVGTKGPIVFFAAHPDDETIGMAGAIRQAITEGRPVYIELMTHGEASSARAMLDDGNPDTWHPGRHVYPLSVEDFGDARVREFQDAMGRLGVTGVHVSDFGNGKLTPGMVGERVHYWLSRQFRGLSLRGTAGAQDPQEAQGTAPHPDHAAVWEALVTSGHPDVLGYCIYQASTGHCRYDAEVDVHAWCEDKRDALAAYETWQPLEGRFAIAFHSTHGLLEAVGANCVEYVVKPDPLELVPFDAGVVPPGPATHALEP